MAKWGRRAKREDPRITRLVVSFLRSCAGLTQGELAAACRITQSDVSQFELGKRTPTEEVLRRMAAASKVPWPLAQHLRRLSTVVLAAADRRLAIDVFEPLELSLFEPTLMAMTDLRFDRPAEASTTEAARAEAEMIWPVLEHAPRGRRKRLVELALGLFPAWALVERLCEASVQAAAHDSGEALARAELALSIADRAPISESCRPRLQGYASAFLANAHRVANDFAGADRDFARAWEHWAAGAASAEVPLAEWRLLDLEASLRRSQHQFPVALELLDRARAVEGVTAAVAGRLLLKKGNICEQMGDSARALAVLAEAAPLLEAAGDPRLLLALRFDTANNLYLLGHFAEGAKLLSEIRALALSQGNGLDLIRVRWLEARTAAGLGRREEATTALEEVRRDFTDRQLPYDAALATLELAVLYLEAGRTAEVRELAVAMAWIFKAQGIAREALAALKLFCEAVERESASAEMARRVIGEIQGAQRARG